MDSPERKDPTRWIFAVIVAVGLGALTEFMSRAPGGSSADYEASQAAASEAAQALQHALPTRLPEGITLTAVEPGFKLRHTTDARWLELDPREAHRQLAALASEHYCAIPAAREVILSEGTTMLFHTPEGEQVEAFVLSYCPDPTP